MSNKPVLLKVENLKKQFPLGQKFLGHPPVLKAVDGISLTIGQGETLGLVGESGCGKSTVGRTILRLYEPTAGKIFLAGENISSLSASAMKAMRKRMQLIFQDPASSLNPRMIAGEIVAEPLEIHHIGSRQEQKARVAELFELVGLSREIVGRFPHELSGGQCQRVCIARALACNPEFIVCDEPTSALDVSVQGQILNLMHDLQQNLGLTYLFIAHDLSIVRYMSDCIAVMYLGKIVEMAETEELFANPLHPYTKALLQAIPITDPKSAAVNITVTVKGEPPDPINIPAGCSFRTRCPKATTTCAKREPALVNAGNGHYAACNYI